MLFSEKHMIATWTGGASVRRMQTGPRRRARGDGKRLILGLCGLGMLVAFVAGCASFTPAPRQTTLAADRVELPTEWRGHWLCITARIDGAGPFRLMVDTGATGLLLRASIAQQVAARNPRQAVITTPAGKFETRIVTVGRLESGGMTLVDVPAFVLDQSQTALLGNLFDGVIGIGAFRDVIAEFDFPAGRIAVYRRDLARFSACPAVSYDEVVPAVTIDVAGRPVRAIVDTGSTFHLILPNLERYPLAVPITLDRGAGGMAIGSKGFDREENSQLKGLARWGPVTWENPPLRRQTQGAVGNIGVGVLDRLKFAIDGRAKRIYFSGGELTRKWKVGAD